MLPNVYISNVITQMVNRVGSGEDAKYWIELAYISVQDFRRTVTDEPEWTEESERVDEIIEPPPADVPKAPDDNVAQLAKRVADDTANELIWMVMGKMYDP